MPRINSDGSAGVQTGSVSSVYTLLLIVALVATVGSVIFMVTVNSDRFGYSMPIGDEYENAVKDRESFATDFDNVAKAIKDETTGNALKLDVVTEAGVQ